MRLPIRIRLTVWYVLLLAVAIAALGAFVVVRLRADLTADFDRSLRSAAAQIRRGYERRGAIELQALGSEVLRVLPGDAGSQLIGADGRLAHVSGSDLPRTPLIAPAQWRAVLGGRDLTLTRHAPSDSEPFRVYATAVAHDGRRATLLVASSLEGVDAAVQRALTLVLIAGPALLLASAGGGWWLAGKALRPIVRLVEEKRRLVADASHELRTPLAVMRSELDVALAYDDLQPAAARVLDSTRQEVERMTRTVENLLTLARFDEGRLELLPRPFELRELIDDVAATLAPVAAERDVTIAAEGEGSVRADRERIRQAVANLIDNAVKYSHPGGAVDVAIRRTDGEVRVSVTDAGVGIPAEALGQVFERFYRADGARTRARGGSGLGLAICREIALAHGGRVWAESAEGRGSRFSLALPA